MTQDCKFRHTVLLFALRSKSVHSLVRNFKVGTVLEIARNIVFVLILTHTFIFNNTKSFVWKQESYSLVYIDLLIYGQSTTSPHNRLKGGLQFTAVITGHTRNNTVLDGCLYFLAESSPAKC